MLTSLKLGGGSVADMDFCALGPLVVLRDAEAVDLGPPKQRALLALLLINANHPLSIERILDELWGDEGADKENALRVHVSRLRSVLDPERSRGEASVLETQGRAYQLTIDPNHFDVVRFEDLVAQGTALLSSDAGAAAESLAAALELWNGPAFDDFAYDDFARAESDRLNQARASAFEDRIEADLALGRAGELVSELETLRGAHPLRERLVSHQALALYRSGRPADALRAIDRFRRHVGEELGIDPSPRLLRLEEQVLLHDSSIQPRSTSTTSSLGPTPTISNPFKGLRPFGTDDAANFFGRDALVAELLRTLGNDQRLVALVGASGSGKSSSVRAGLIPALAKGAIAGSDQWLVANMMPGAHPFAELEAALLRTVLDGPANLDEQLRDGDAGLVRAALRVFPDNDARLLLIIDQFEELFTMVEDETVRSRFLSNLVTAVDDPHRRIMVLVTLRADFYSQPLQHPEFGARLGNGIVNVTPLSAEELEAAALKPAEQVGVGIEPALLGQLISDVGNQPGALPLFQYALTELFDRRSGNLLQASTYRSMGGLGGALQRRATDLYEDLDDAQQEAARQLFLRLVSITEHDRRSRRRVAAREVASLAVDTVTMHDVIRQFGEHRLLSYDSDPLTGAPTVEVAHEALLTSWPTVEGWIDESRDDLRRHGSLAMGVREWELADRNPDYLLTPARLSEHNAWSQSSRMSLNTAEQAFVDASSDQVEEQQAKEQRRLQHETRSRRRLWGLVTALAGSLGVAALFLLGAFAGNDDPAVMFFANRLDDQWFANVGTGLDRADRELDMELINVSWRADPVAEFRELAASGPKYIIISESITIAFDPTVVDDFPDVQFGVVDGTVSGPNVTSVGFANEEGAYLAGVAAALKTETGTVGFIGGSDEPETEAFRAGFEDGVHSVDTAITVLATYVNQFDDVNGHGRPDLGEARATALYERGADVLFAAAGTSGLGMFTAAASQSDVMNRHLWAIGVDNDQWFEVKPQEQPHVLTSIVKRGDLAAFRLVEHMLDDGPTGVAFEFGVAEGGFDYSTQSDGLTTEIATQLDQTVADIAEDRINVPIVAIGPTLTLDLAGDEIDVPRGVDGFDLRVPIPPGTYELHALGTPFTLTIPEDWSMADNIPGATGFIEPLSGRGELWFFRPTLLADPAQPQADVGDQTWWPLDDIDGWLSNLIDDIVTTGPERTEIGGRSAVYFEAEPANSVCGGLPHCAGFVINTFLGPSAVSAWSFEPGSVDRVWWVDGGDEAPFVIIASALADDLEFQNRTDELLASLEIGEPLPHPAVDQ